MSTTAATTLNTGGVDPDERIVEEVHCIECGVPISAIPSWYANVNVKFTCDTCRQKSSRPVPTPASLTDNEGVRSKAAASDETDDADADAADDDAEIDDVEIDDTDSEAEPEEE